MRGQLIRPTRSGQNSNENRTRNHVIFVTTKTFVNQKFKMYDRPQSFDFMGLIRYVRNINDKTSLISFLSLTFAAVDCNKRCLQNQSCIRDNLEIAVQKNQCLLQSTAANVKLQYEIELILSLIFRTYLMRPMRSKLCANF